MKIKVKMWELLNRSGVVIAFPILAFACTPNLSVVVNKDSANGVKVSSLSLLVIKPNEEVTFTGTALSKNLKLSISGTAVTIEEVNETSGTFVMPDIAVGLKVAQFSVANTEVGKFEIISDSAGDGLPIMPLKASEVCKGISFRNADGAVTAGSMECIDPNSIEYCKLDGETACVASESLPAISRSEVEPELVKVHYSISIAGMDGEMEDCGSSTTVGCFVSDTSSYEAVLAKALDRTKFLETYEDLGIPGGIEDCDGSGSNECYATGLYFAGEACTANASKCYLPAYEAGTQTLKAINFDSITPGVIKKDEVIATIVGNYPSATYPLSSSDGFDDLTTGNFLTKIKGGGSFGWFDRDGNRLTSTGDADIASSKIKDGIDIFGVTGALKVPVAWDVRVGESYGNSETGKLKINCGNRVNTSLWDIAQPPTMDISSLATSTADDSITIPDHGFSTGDGVRIDYYGGLAAPNPLQADTIYFVIKVDDDTFRLAASHGDATAGTPVPINITVAGSYITAYKVDDGTASFFDTIDDFNNGGALPSQNPWSSSDLICEGLESTPDDANVWKDVSAAGCSSDPANCRMQDKITGLQWSKLVASLASGQGPWGVAVATCDGLSYDSQSDWRLPTQKELLAAYSHGMRSAASADWIADANFNNNFWAATTSSASTDKAWAINLAKGSSSAELKTQVYKVICVRD